MNEKADKKSKQISAGAAARFDEAVDAARRDSLERILKGSMIVAALGVVVHVLGADIHGALAYLTGAAVLFVLIRQAGWPFRLRAGGFLVVFYLAGLLSILRTGITSSGALYLAAVPPLTMLLFGSNFGLATILVSASAWLGAGILFSAAGIRIPEPVSGDIFVWLYAGVDLLLIIVVFVQFFRQFRQTQEFAVKVAQQERDLQIAGQRYTQQLAAVAEVGRAVTTRLELQDLLGILVELLQETFGYYGVNVWLLSEPPDLVQLKAGYNPQGEDLSKMDIQVSMEEEDHITWVCKTGQPKLTADLESQPTIGLDSALALDDFPSARSQLLLPLQLTHKRLGALEILSDRPDIFGDEDVVLMQSLADQLTIAIRNATLYEGERQRRHLAETLYQVGRACSFWKKIIWTLWLCTVSRVKYRRPIYVSP